MANNLCHFELLWSDVGRAKEFYGRVFDWEFEDVTTAVPYTIVRTGKDPSGHITVKPPEPCYSGLMAYYQVEDVSETLMNATEAGGMIIIPLTAIPNVGVFGVFSDPEGVLVGVFHPNK